ncbi:MAG: ABC transporter permease [Actinomycetes bacterium]
MRPFSTECLVRNDWICGEYVRSRRSELTEALTQHITLTVVSVLIGLALAIPLAVLARRLHLTQVLLGAATIIYTIPSVALFSLFIPFTGITATTVVIGLVLYSLTVLVRNALAGLDAVPDGVREAARGMGMGSTRMMLRVELPLAVPAIMAGVRIATVSTVALTTVGGIIGYGGLGNLIFQGLNTTFRSQVLTASVLCVALAIAADISLLGAQRLIIPWQRAAVR